MATSPGSRSDQERSKAGHSHTEHPLPERPHAEHSHAGHHHHPAPTDFGRSFAVAIALNCAFVATEFTFGLMANSTALMADAGHNLSDVLGLLLAWGGAILARKTPGGRFTYGMSKASIMAALANAILLLVACGAIAWEAMHRFSQPAPVAGLTVSLVAASGIAINGISAWLFVRGSKTDLNIRAAYLHMLADAAISLGVAVTGVAMLLTGWNWLDPMVSLVIVLVIIAGTWGLLREASELALGAIPKQVDARALETYLRSIAGVSDIHDLHIWAISTTQTALTVHLVMPNGYPGDHAMDDITRTLNSQFGIAHSTLQTEMGTTRHSCTLQVRSYPSGGHHATVDQPSTSAPHSGQSDRPRDSPDHQRPNAAAS